MTRMCYLCACVCVHVCTHVCTPHVLRAGRISGILHVLGHIFNCIYETILHQSKTVETKCEEAHVHTAL